MTDSQGREALVYGAVDGNLVFIPRARAEELAAAHRALHTATTWGAFKGLVSEEIYEEAVERVADSDDDAPTAPESDVPLVPDDIVGYNDGDWPAWPAAEMLEWLPQSIEDAYGHSTFTALRQDFLQLDSGRSDEIIAALVTEGFTVTEDVDLVIAASGMARNNARSDTAYDS